MREPQIISNCIGYGAGTSPIGHFGCPGVIFRDVCEYLKRSIISFLFLCHVPPACDIAFVQHSHRNTAKYCMLQYWAVLILQIYHITQSIYAPLSQFPLHCIHCIHRMRRISPSIPRPQDSEYYSGTVIRHDNCTGPLSRSIPVLAQEDGTERGQATVGLQHRSPIPFRGRGGG
jgi:hypothetical protein